MAKFHGDRYWANGGAIQGSDRGTPRTIATVRKDMFTPEGRTAIAEGLAAAPDLYYALKGLLEQLRSSRMPKLDVRKDYHLMVALEAAKVAVEKVEGWP